MRRGEKLCDVVAQFVCLAGLPPGWKDARVRSGQDGGDRYITGDLAASPQQIRPAPPHHTSHHHAQVRPGEYLELSFTSLNIYLCSFML